MYTLNKSEIKTISGGATLEGTFTWTIYGMTTDCVLDYLANHPANGLKNLDEIFDEMDNHCFNTIVVETSEAAERAYVTRPNGHTYISDYRTLSVKLL